MNDRDALANLIDPDALELDAYPWPRDAADRVLASGWLAGVKAAAWEEGHSHCFHVERPNPTPNPYREERP